ncbi:MAG: DUF389 domain-containing protein [Solirubrobacterales bacterium]
MGIAQTVLRGPMKDPDEIRGDLDFTVGDVTAKHSRFWLLLLLSGVIASAGVLTDSTATVIGAMIIAPLATPIQAIGYATVSAQAVALQKATALVLGGAAAVVGVAALTYVVMPEVVPLATNSQINSRVSPNLVDLLAAVATGLAGAMGIARRDISDIVPGVAIAISLVPPLAVVGVTAVAGHWGDSFGALMLFAANVLAIILTTALVFIWMGMRPEEESAATKSIRRARIAIGAGLVLVLIMLSAVTVRTTLLLTRSANAEAAAREWAEPQDLKVSDAKYSGSNLEVHVAGTKPADTSGLLEALGDAVPKGTVIELVQFTDQRRTVGTVGD